jgi:hypothetical protein
MIDNTPSEQNTSDLVFPLEMRGSGLANKPVILFTAFDKKENKPIKIFLPTPIGVSFGDKGEYSTMDLGVIGGMALGGGPKLSSINTENIRALAGSKLGVGEQTSFLTKQVKNPNTNTTFTANTLRTFAFNFKLIASSEEESEIIRQIHTRFRYYAYADMLENEDNILLNYPPVWTIKFMDMGTGEENKFIPRIFSTYLASCDSTFNAGGNMYYNNNAPLEIDMSLMFQETRTLTRKDIREMENDQLGNRGINENGNPTVSGAASTNQLNTGVSEITGDVEAKPKRRGRRRN